MSKVRTVSRFALFFLVMAVATTAVAAEKATPSGKVAIESYFDCCWHWSELGRWEADLQREDLPVLHRRSIAGGLGHRQSAGDWGCLQFNRCGEVRGNLCGRGSRAHPGRRHGRHGAAQSGWRGLALAFCFSGRPAATRHQRIDHQDEVIK